MKNQKEKNALLKKFFESIDKNNKFSLRAYNDLDKKYRQRREIQDTFLCFRERLNLLAEENLMLYTIIENLKNNLK